MTSFFEAIGAITGTVIKWLFLAGCLVTLVRWSLDMDAGLGLDLIKGSGWVALGLVALVFGVTGLGYGISAVKRMTYILSGSQQDRWSEIADGTDRGSND